MMRKNLRQSIVKSLGRYIAIVAIIALGAGIFVGLLSTRTDMIATCQQYTDQQNMFDLRLLNTYGWTQEDVYDVSNLPGVVDAEGTVGLDVLLYKEEGKDSVYHLLSMPETVNNIQLIEGRMPQNSNECLADGYYASGITIGTEYTVSDANDEDTLDALCHDTYTVVGLVSSPLYMNMERGNTSLGNGSIASYLYLPADGFNVDYFTEIYVTILGDYAVYSDEYNDALDNAVETVEPVVQKLADQRYEQILKDAQAEYTDGMAQYEDGLKEYQDGKAEAEEKFVEAEKELDDNEDLLKTQRQALEDGKQQLEDAEILLNESSKTIISSRQDLADAESDTYAQLADANAQLLENYKTVISNLREVESGLTQINSGLTQIDSGIIQLESGLEQISSGISQIDTMISLIDTAANALQSTLDGLNELPVKDEEAIAKLEEQLLQLQQKRDSYAQQRQELVDSQTTYSAQLEDLKAQQEALQQQKAELESTQSTLNAALDTINAGFMETQNEQTQAANQFSAAKSKLEAAQLEIENGLTELDQKRQELEAGEATLAEAEEKLAGGRAALEESREETSQTLREAKQELDDAKQELLDAREEIDGLQPATAYVLTRNTNVGYVSLESDSDIVAGVSRVFPAFFLLVAALVCITTMTRMVNEERTQIGTLKALGYSNQSIISKYLAYSGSAAIVGCGLGVLIGSVVFPQIIWKAYSIMYNVSDWVIMKFDWPLCLAVVVAYTAVAMFVTWYCCRWELREVPAELMRPKAPTTGKKIWMERLPVWKHIRFLNKVAIRNVFRYRQRLAMMLLGIGGCTALLVTGFGLRDSISSIVDYQFEEVTVYDMSVTFGEAQSEEQQEHIYETVGRKVDGLLFYHQGSMELDFDNRVKDTQLLVSDERLADYMDLHQDKTSLAMPGLGEVLVSVGTAEALNLDTGDVITLRNSDMDTLTLTVSGIFDNMVNSYVIVSNETWEAQIGEPVELQSALVNVSESYDVHEVSAAISGMDDVLNVTVSVDLADRVSSMMDALDLVVITIVICAGLLAVIVLYNLTNININERVREIATIKVLGFRSDESAAYVFKENLGLSMMGALPGLVGGKYLLDFVMSQIKLDMVWMTARPTVFSYLLSVAMTILAACAVDVFFYFKLERINMAEALKPAE